MSLSLFAPVDGVITGRFGDLYSDAQGNTWAHRGVDYGVPAGTPVKAPCAGNVVSFTNDGSFGVGVCIYSEGLYVLCAHNSQKTVTEGQWVEQGGLIAYSGATGTVTGPHVHLQVCVNSTFPTDISFSLDPLLYMDEPMTPEQIKKLDDVWRVLCAGNQFSLEAWNMGGNSMVEGYSQLFNRFIMVVRELKAQGVNLTDSGF